MDLVGHLSDPSSTLSSPLNDLFALDNPLSRLYDRPIPARRMRNRTGALQGAPPGGVGRFGTAICNLATKYEINRTTVVEPPESRGVRRRRSRPRPREAEKVAGQVAAGGSVAATSSADTKRCDDPQEELTDGEHAGVRPRKGGVELRHATLYAHEDQA
jgi:hypothetical protein